LTLKEFDALCKRRKQDERRQESHSALIACMLYNIHRGKGSAKNIQDFMSREMTVKKKQTTEEMIAAAKFITRALGGDIKCQK
jgi:transaldolase